MQKTIWLFGLSGAGKTTLASQINKIYRNNNIKTVLLDGDIIREGISNNLGFSQEDRNENIRRIAEICKLMLDINIVPIVAAITPYKAQRQLACEIIGANKLVFTHIKCPLVECEQRDPKQLYHKARSGLITNFTGISDKFEDPKPNENCIEVSTSGLTIKKSVDSFFSLVDRMQN